MRRTAAVLILSAAAALAACAPSAPEGVDEAVLDRAIGNRIGDPSTCVLVARADTGDVVYRYGTAVVCGRAYPGCRGEGVRTTQDLLDAYLETPESVAISCPTAADGSRSVGWAAGPVAGRPLVFAAVMEGQRALPGMVMTDRLAGAFSEAGMN